MLIGFGLGFGAASWWDRRKDVETELSEEIEATEDDEPVELEPPEIKIEPWDWISAGRYLKKQKKAAKKGYIKWYRLGSNMKRPLWIKPKRTGSGTLKYRHDGKPYYFNEDAMTVDARTGAWVAIHREGESDPIDLTDPAYPGIEADLIERIINLEAESDPPGLFGNLDLSMQTIMWIGIGTLFLVFAGMRMMNGGM